MAIQIHLLAGPQAGRRLVIRDSPITIGRDPSCDLVINEPAVSRRQLRLEQSDDGQWWIVNESDQGTSLGWRRITNQPRAVTGKQKLSVAGVALVEISLVDEEAVDDSAACGLVLEFSG